VASIVGHTLSHYRVTSAIGAGGMGEVYRATDTTLGREVAIKVLPPEVAEDPDRLARFRREAHLLASLNHPNIAAIYGLEEADGRPFLALELVEGEDLKERLARGPIPVDEVIEIATQVAEALEEAHNKGIVHRDLKPANVKLSTTGKVKVLDFGLAKAWAGDASGVRSSSPIVSQSPTLAHDATLAGVVLGTVAYMAPEQARGKGVDRRADVWAFGVLVWEMLTGRALFAGETVTDVIAAVVTKEPDLGALPADTPPALRRLVSRCLRKDPRQRLPDIGAARLELQELGAGTSTEADTVASLAPSSAERTSRTRERLAWAAAILAIAGVAGTLAFVHLREVETPRPAARFAVEAPAGWDFDVAFGWPMPSPDGRQVVFQARPSGGDATAASMLWVRPLESLTARPLAGSEGGYLPAWSPDGASLAFVAANEIRRLSLADGTVQRVCAVPVPGGEAGIDWNESGTILFSAGGTSGQIYSVAAAGGEAKPLMTLDKARGETNHHMPQFLPDGRRFLFLVGGEKVGGVYVASLATPTDRRQVVTGWRRSVYASGHLLFVRDGTLLAQPFDPEQAAPSGEPVTIASSVASWTNNAAFGWFAASPAGTLAYFSGTSASTQFQLAWVDRKGTEISKLGEPGAFAQLTLSPDERNVALEVVDAEGQYDLWVMDVARGVISRVTAAQGSERDPVWAPDGRSLVFIARDSKGATLRRKGLRAGDPETVIDGGSRDELIPENWLRDGQTLLVLGRDPAKDTQNVLAVPVKGGHAEPLLSGFRFDEPQVSPDGRWLTYVSRESGQDEVYLEPFRREGTRVRVSPAGGGQPKWRGDGRELFFTTPTNHLMTVAVRTEGDRVDVSLPTDLFEIRGLEGTGTDDYAPSADGQRFLVKQSVQQERKPQLQIVTNWTSLLHTQ
jgi:eukaryotic-like serine/threonine-protein kinase